MTDDFDGSWAIEGAFGALQGAAFKETFDRYEEAEVAADRAQARAEYGDDARVEHLARTPAQRRADALFEMARRSVTTPADGRHGHRPGPQAPPVHRVQP